jgi:hypothetical protein
MKLENRDELSNSSIQCFLMQFPYAGLSPGVGLWSVLFMIPHHVSMSGESYPLVIIPNWKVR